jgi:hypothetical protein
VGGSELPVVGLAAIRSLLVVSADHDCAITEDASHPKTLHPNRVKNG